MDYTKWKIKNTGIKNYNLHFSLGDINTIEHTTKNIQGINKSKERFINFKNKFKKNGKNIVKINSKIYVSNNKLCYIDKRSIYSAVERFTDTLKTINSVKKNI